MPDARVLEQLCALSGDDLAVVMAQIQAERERTSEGRALWLRVAARLSGGVAMVLVLCITALPSPPAMASTLAQVGPALSNSVSYVKSLMFEACYRLYSITRTPHVLIRLIHTISRCAVATSGN